jgi:5-(carboxyamino)imidazole ribonucleotide synthase
MRVGILGGGQLGRMLALSGYPLGLTFRFFDPSPDSPARHIGELIAAPYDDHAALRRFARDLDVVTYEFESVPVTAVEQIATLVPVFPPARALAAAQDRLRERETLTQLGIAVAPYASVDSRDTLTTAAENIGYPALLKTRTLGYDGKGQALVHTPGDLDGAWTQVGERPAILERFVSFSRELSVLGVRTRNGDFAVYPLVENQHSEGILRFSFAPAEAGEGTRAAAEDIVRRLADALDYVGVLAVELFDTEDGLVANEIAPRVHNSAHWTIEGAETSQFENHLRAILGYPLGSTQAIGHSAMVNVIGRVPPLERLLAVADVHVHMYGKSASHRRKLGHVTVRADDPVTVRERLKKLRQVLARE